MPEQNDYIGMTFVINITVQTDERIRPSLSLVDLYSGNDKEEQKTNV